MLVCIHTVFPKPAPNIVQRRWQLVDARLVNCQLIVDHLTDLGEFVLLEGEHFGFKLGKFRAEIVDTTNGIAETR